MTDNQQAICVLIFLVSFIIVWSAICKWIIFPRMDRDFAAKMEASKDPNSPHYWRLDVTRSMQRQGLSPEFINEFMYRGTPEYRAEQAAREARLRRAYPHIFASQPIPDHRPQHASQDADDGR